jgi:hypothetical protein
MQLFSSWTKLEDNIVYFELSSASARIGTNISNLFLIINNPLLSKSNQSQLDYWNAYLRGHRVIEQDTKLGREFKLQPNGDYTLSVYDMALAIIRRSNQTDFYGDNNYRVKVVVYTFATLSVLIPLGKFVTHRHAMDDPLLMTIYFISSNIIIFQYACITFFLLYIAIVDVLRQYCMVCQLHCMLRLTDLMMHVQLTVGVHTLTEQSLVSARQRLDAIMSIQDFNERKVATTAAMGQTQLSHAQHLDAAYNPLSGVQTAQLVSDQCSPHKVLCGISKVLCGDKNTTNSSKNSDDCEDENEDDEDGQTDTTEFSSMRNHSTHSGMLGEDRYVTRCSVIGEQIATDSHTAITPRISFQHPQNAMCWAYTRLIVQNFGERFRFRLDTYVGAFPVFNAIKMCSDCVVSIALFLLLLVILTTFALGTVFMSTDSNRAFQSTFFLQSFLSLTVGVVFMLLFSYSASLVNTELQMHRWDYCAL